MSETSISDARPADSLVSARDVTKTYTLGEQQIRALDGASLDIRKGEFVAIMGPSGSGKSTLMNLIGGLDVPSSGSLHVMGKDLSSLSPNELAELRNSSIGFVFQQFNLLPRTSALQQVLLPLSYARTPVSRAVERAHECLEAVDLGNRKDHHPTQLSGGQQQRVAIARALVNDPGIILADEPTGALDSRTSREILELFCEINARGKTLIVVTHDRDTAAYANRLITCHDGRIVSDERTDQRTAETVS